MTPQIDTATINHNTDLRQLAGVVTQLQTTGNNAKSNFGPCPMCGGRDRFVVYREKFLCRICHKKYGDAIEFAAWLNGFDSHTRDGLTAAAQWLTGGPTMQIDPDKLAEWKRQEEERKATEYASTLEKIERLNKSNNVARYHSQLDAAARQWWQSKGLNDASIARWKVGYTSNCPTAPGEAAYTIPITYQGKLYNIRHRLAAADNGNKYRPEMAGLPSAMFNADILRDDSGFVSEVVLVEGEIKTMVLEQYGFSAIGIPGAQTFKEKWLHLFAGCDKRIYVALDPGVEAQAARIWQELTDAGVSAKLCNFPVKPDDFLSVYGGSPLEFYQYLILGDKNEG